MPRFSRSLVAVTAASLATLLAATTIAEAASHHRHLGRALTVKKRPFTDSGNVVPIGSQSHYVYDSQSNGRTPDTYYAPGRYGNETLPGQFYVPGVVR